jgi:hypothetical protein
VLTVSANWTTAPDATSEYALFPNMTLTATDISLGNVAIENAAGDASAPVSATNGLAVYLPTATVSTLTPIAAAAIATAQLGGLSSPQPNLVTDGAGAWADVAIPANTKYVDFLVDLAASVCANTTNSTPFGTNAGVPYQPNLNFRLPCFGATYLHLKGTSAAVHTLKWNAIS